MFRFNAVSAILRGLGDSKTPLYFLIVFSGMFVFQGVLRGAGATFIPMLFTILALWLIRIPVSVWLSGRLGTDGIWWGVPIAWVIGLILSMTYYGTGTWRKKAVLIAPVPAKADDAQATVLEALV